MSFYLKYNFLKTEGTNKRQIELFTKIRRRLLPTKLKPFPNEAPYFIETTHD
ncbi:hypothetical protein BH09BAC3_BH09BAC3_14120 [soil metagenome]